MDDDGVFMWATSNTPLTFSNFWSDMGPLEGKCLQLLRNGFTEPHELDSYYWVYSGGFPNNCTMDIDNGFICEAAGKSTINVFIHLYLIHSILMFLQPLFAQLHLLMQQANVF